MADIQAKSGNGSSVVDKVVNTVKHAIDKFFGFLEKLDDDPKLKLSNGKFKKTGDKSGVFTAEYDNKVPVAVEVKVHNDDESIADYKFYINDTDGMKHPVEYKNQPFMYRDDPDFIEMYTDAMSKIITKDVKQAFGIKLSKTLNVRLHKVMGAKDTSIMLTGIKANFNISEANAIFADILDNDEFIEQLTDEPVSYEIVDTDDDYEISSIDQAQIDFMNEGFKTILCAAIKFNMAMQILHWQTYNDEKLFTITNDMLWQSQDCMNQFGMWVIEFNNEVTSAMISESCLSSFTAIETYEGSIGAEIKGAISEFVDILNFEWPNFPHDIQNELDLRIRRMNETVDLGLRDY